MGFLPFTGQINLEENELVEGDEKQGTWVSSFELTLYHSQLMLDSSRRSEEVAIIEEWTWKQMVVQKTRIKSSTQLNCWADTILRNNSGRTKNRRWAVHARVPQCIHSHVHQTDVFCVLIVVWAIFSQHKNSTYTRFMSIPWFIRFPLYEAGHFFTILHFFNFP